MNCNWLTNNLGFECREVKTLRHESALAVDTPFSFTDGEAIGFYLVHHNAALRVTDNGDTIAHLINMGLGYQDARRWSALRHRAEAHGLALSKEGEIYAVGPANSPDTLASHYLAGVLAIVEHERESLAAPTDVNVFAEEVEMLLRAWKPTSPIHRHPKVRGLSSKMHTFDFEVDNLLVDAISPHALSSGSLLRKAGDLASGPDAESYEIMAIIDDRHDPEAAQVERNIVSSLVKAALYSRLEEKLHPAHEGSEH